MTLWAPGILFAKPIVLRPNMKETESLIIQLINEYGEEDDSNYQKKGKIDKLFSELMSQPFASSSVKFINHPVLLNYVSLLKEFDCDAEFLLWFAIESYLLTKDRQPEFKKEKLGFIEQGLQAILVDHLVVRQAKISPKQQGIELLPDSIANKSYIRKIFSTNDQLLIKLFFNYFPRPRADIFEPNQIPIAIAQNEQDASRAIKKTLKSNDNNLAFIEEQTIKLQRIFRAQQRKKEEVFRVATRHEGYIQKTQSTAEQLLDDANTPYLPKCNTELAKRLVKAATQVKLFSSEIRHFTANAALENIFNDALYGRRTLLQNYMFFRPSVLNSSDQKRGDANVICFGANEIDPGAIQLDTVELVLDTARMPEKNPCAFYKQKDLGFILNEKQRKVVLGDLELNFSHTRKLSYSKEREGYVNFQLFNDTSLTAFAEIPDSLLIAYDLQKMQQILALNFFRFIDKLHIPQAHRNSRAIKAQVIIDDIYSRLNQLSDEKLVCFLYEVGSQMSDTMEYNFYGAHKIDFSSIVRISTYNATTIPLFTLHLDTFFVSLQSGNMQTLDDAKKHLPGLFKSYRFIDYLLTKTSHEAMIFELCKIREQCKTPLWLEEENKQDKSLNPRN